MKKFFLKHQAGFILLILSVVSLLGMWFSNQTNMVSPREIAMVVTSGVQQAVVNVGDFFNSTFNSIHELSDLKKDYALVEKKLQDLEQQQSNIELLRQENQYLKLALGFSQDLSYENIPAKIIGKEPGVLFSSLTINKGYNQGVRPQMPVISIVDGKQNLVGKIGEVSLFSAQVIPLFDQRNNLGARIVNSRYEGLLMGSGAVQTDLSLIFVDPQAQSLIKLGDLVCTSGLSTIFPPDIPIGEISSISLKPTESSLNILVKPFADYSRLEYVYILNKKSENPE